MALFQFLFIVSIVLVKNSGTVLVTFNSYLLFRGAWLKSFQILAGSAFQFLFIVSGYDEETAEGRVHVNFQFLFIVSHKV